MDVSQILALLGTLSIGLDEPTDSDIPVFLRFLNLAYVELLQETLVLNPTIPILTEVLDCVDGVVPPTVSIPFNVRCVWDNTQNIPLTATTLEEIQKTDPAVSQVGGPQKWYMSGGLIKTYPLYTGKIGVRYIAEPDELKANTVSSEILIPKMYQNILADGGAYYMFQSETGFKDSAKLNSSIQKWMDGKRKLALYLKNLGGKQYYSTYSAV